MSSKLLWSWNCLAYSNITMFEAIDNLDFNSKLRFSMYKWVSRMGRNSLLLASGLRVLVVRVGLRLGQLVLQSLVGVPLRKSANRVGDVKQEVEWWLRHGHGWHQASQDQEQEGLEQENVVELYEMGKKTWWVVDTVSYRTNWSYFIHFLVRGQ